MSYELAINVKHTALSSRILYVSNASHISYCQLLWYLRCTVILITPFLQCSSTKAKELSEGMRGQIITSGNEGFSQRKIAEKIELSKGAVQRTLERFRDTGSYSTKRRSGRPSTTTLKEEQ